VLIKGAEVWGFGLTDVRIEGERIVAVGELGPADEPVIVANGALLLPGLHDHHIHLAALAAKRASVQCGPPEVTDAGELAAALAAPGEGWIRGIGYHESVMGLPTARELDSLVLRRPVRIQHRSGRLWLLNSMAIEQLLARGPAPPGLNRTTGHLFDEDRWLRDTLGSAPPGFAQAGRVLAAWGITGVTDMSPANDPAMASHFAAERLAGHLPQRVVLAGSLALAQAERGPWQLGPAKLHLHEAALPDFAAAAGFISEAHAQERLVAIHCVSEVELVFALAALEEAGSRPGDRIEHASVASDELVARIAALGLAVCAQPNFVRERGDAYLRDVEPRHHAELYRLRSFVAAGVPLAGGSDAPFGSADPWAGMAAAVKRATADGKSFGPSEALTPEEALRLYLADPRDLAAERRIEPGAPADLCLIDRPWDEARRDLSAVTVRATWVSGRLVHDRVDQAPVQSDAGGQAPPG
jgi:predicted amidohydrolase YtcJ